MDPSSGDAAGDSQLTDIQSYLATFNKEISSGNQQGATINQEYILQQSDLGNVENVTFFTGEPPSYSDSVGEEGQDGGKVTKMEQQGDQEESNAQVDQPLLTPAPPTLTTDEDGQQVMAVSAAQLQQLQATGQLTTSSGQPIITTTPGGTIQLVGQPDGGDSSEAAVQVLASVAATSIPQAETHNAQLVAVQGEGGVAQPQLVAVQNSIGSPQPQLVAMQQSQQEQNGQIVVQPQGGDAQTSADGQQNSVVLNTGSSYQTVTIVPSEVNQGGEVSYVLIVSQPDGEQNQRNQGEAVGDMSVFDFKEEGKAQGIEEDDEPDPAEMGQKKIIKVTPKKTPIGMQAQLMCNYCNYTSPKRYLLTRHMKTHSEERPHKCNICDRGFKTVASLQNHINTHTGVRPHKCKECDAAFTTSGELVRHVRYRHTFEKPHRCTECDYSSVELSKLKRHMRSHTGERPYQCPHCTYASPDTYKLKRHLRIHTGEKPYECDICHARFTQSNSLKAHKLIHTGNKPVFQCELCPTTCGRKTDLKIHVQKLHTSERPLQCKKCGKSFPDRYTYKIHLKTHEGEKCYKCELCPYAALSQRHLESHILTHTGEKPYQCDECDQSFRQKQLLKRHKNLYHNPDYIPPPPKEKTHECSECHKVFAHRGNLLRHMALHDPETAAMLREEMIAEGYVEGEEEEYDDDEDEDVGLDEDVAGQQIIIRSAGSDAAGNILKAGDGHGQEVQLQLVTVDGENATQIFLQMEEGAEEDEDEEEVQKEEEEEEEVEPEDQPEAQEVQTPPATPVRRRGRPPKALQLQMDNEAVEEEEVEEKKTPRRGRPPKPLNITPSRATRGRRSSEIVVKQEEMKEEEEESPRKARGRKRQQAEEVQEEEVATPKKRGRPPAQPQTDSAKRGRRRAQSQSAEEGEDEDSKREKQKQKDIEECFGFGIDD